MEVILNITINPDERELEASQIKKHPERLVFTVDSSKREINPYTLESPFLRMRGNSKEIKGQLKYVIDLLCDSL